MLYNEIWGFSCMYLGFPSANNDYANSDADDFNVHDDNADFLEEEDKRKVILMTLTGNGYPWEEQLAKHGSWISLLLRW